MFVWVKHSNSQKHEREQKLVNSVTAEECFVRVYLTYTGISLFSQMIGLHFHERFSAFLMPHFPIDTNFSRQATQAWGF